MCMGLVVFMGVFIKVFGYNTPSQNPKRQQRAQQQPPRNAQPRHKGRGAAAVSIRFIPQAEYGGSDLFLLHLAHLVSIISVEKEFEACH